MLHNIANWNYVNTIELIIPEKEIDLKNRFYYRNKLVMNNAIKKSSVSRSYFFILADWLIEIKSVSLSTYDSFHFYKLIFNRVVHLYLSYT